MIDIALIKSFIYITFYSMEQRQITYVVQLLFDYMHEI